MELLPAEVRAQLSQEQRALLRPGIVADGVDAAKLARKHAEVSAAQHRMLQKALDCGELVLRLASGNRPLSLVAFVKMSEAEVRLLRRAKPGMDYWWQYAIGQRGGVRYLVTIFAASSRQRNKVLNPRRGNFVIRSWSQARWNRWNTK